MPNAIVTKSNILAEHVSWGGDSEGVRIKQAPGGGGWFFLYWQDGQIYRRDTYKIMSGKPCLWISEKRYEWNGPWIEER